MYILMKFITIFAIFGMALSVDYQENKDIILAIDNYLETIGHKFREECIASSGVDPVLVERLEKQADLAFDYNLHCYMRCQGIKSEVVDEDGVLDIAALKRVSKATNQKFLDMVESDCKFPKHDRMCEAAYEAVLCAFDVIADHHKIH